MKLQGNAVNSARGFGDNFALLAVATGDGTDEDAVIIDKLKGQAVQLGITPEFHGDIRESPHHAVYKTVPFFRAEDVLEAVHTLLVTAALKAGQKGSARRAAWGNAAT